MKVLVICTGSLSLGATSEAPAGTGATAVPYLVCCPLMAPEWVSLQCCVLSMPQTSCSSTLCTRAQENPKQIPHS